MAATCRCIHIRIQAYIDINSLAWGFLIYSILSIPYKKGEHNYLHEVMILASVPAKPEYFVSNGDVPVNALNLTLHHRNECTCICIVMWDKNHACYAWVPFICAQLWVMCSYMVSDLLATGVQGGNYDTPSYSHALSPPFALLAPKSWIYMYSFCCNDPSLCF